MGVQGVQAGTHRGGYHSVQETTGEVLDILKHQAPTADRAMTPDMLLTQMRERGNLAKLPGKNTLTTLLLNLYAKNREDYLPFVLECVVEQTEQGVTTRLPLEEWEQKYPATQRNKPLFFYLRNTLTPMEWKIFEDMVKVYPYIGQDQADKYLQLLHHMNKTPLPARSEYRYAFRRDGALDFSHIEILDDAIARCRAVTITYGAYRLEPGKSQPVLRPRESHGVLPLHPYALIWSNGYYYLVGKHAQLGLMNLRVDRMLAVTKEPETFVRDAAFDPAQYRDMSPVMYAGATQHIRLSCEERLLNVAVDFFGNAARYMPQADGRFLLETWAVPAGVLLFLRQYLSGIRILEPAALRQQLRDELTRELEQLNE